MNQHRLARSAALGLAVGALAAPAAPAQQQDLRSPDSRDAAAGRGTFNAPDVTVVKVTQPSPPSGGIDWGDAGIGAGSLLGLILLGLGGALTVVQRRKHTGSGGAQPTVATDRLT